MWKDARASRILGRHDEWKHTNQLAPTATGKWERRWNWWKQQQQKNMTSRDKVGWLPRRQAILNDQSRQASSGLRIPLEMMMMIARSSSSGSSFSLFSSLHFLMTWTLMLCLLLHKTNNWTTGWFYCNFLRSGPPTSCSRDAAFHLHHLRRRLIIQRRTRGRFFGLHKTMTTLALSTGWGKHAALVSRSTEKPRWMAGKISEKYKKESHFPIGFS